MCKGLKLPAVRTRVELHNLGGMGAGRTNKQTLWPGGFASRIVEHPMYSGLVVRRGAFLNTPVEGRGGEEDPPTDRRMKQET